MSSNQRLSRSEKYNKKEKSNSRILVIILVFLLSMLAYLTFIFIKNINNGYSESHMTAEVDPNLQSFSVLVMGIDENDSRLAEGQTREDSRTDSLIYMAANKNKNVVNMVSIPRDSLALMREKGDSNNEYFFDKITHAHSYGGVDSTIESVSNLLNAPVNFYILINFKAFEKTIDSLGGIEVEVPFDMVEQDSEGNQGEIHLKQGKQTLNGAEALAFARSRYYDSDIDRGQRQLEIINAVINKAKSLNALTKVTELLEIGGKNVTHNMTVNQIATIISMFTTNNMDVVTHKIGGYDAMMEEVYYYYPSPEHLLYVSSILNDTLDQKLPTKDEIVNIAYQNYMIPLQKQYTKTNLDTVHNRYTPYYYVDFEVGDLYDNLPEVLTKEDLSTSPTINKKDAPVKEEVTQ